MARLLCSDVPPRRCKRWRWVLAAFWLLGLLGGVLAAWAQKLGYASLMYRAPRVPGSVVGFAGVGILPFLISLLAVWCSSAAVLLLVCFSRAFAFGFVYACALWAFGSAGWLVQVMLLFGSWASMPVLYGFWYRHPPGCPMPEPGEAALCASLLFLAGSVNIRVIAPFLAGLIDF